MENVSGIRKSSRVRLTDYVFGPKHRISKRITQERAKRNVAPRGIMGLSINEPNQLKGHLPFNA